VDTYFSATGWGKSIYPPLAGGSLADGKLLIHHWLVEVYLPPSVKVYLSATGLWKPIYLPLAKVYLSTSF
jgi:hypothetical protein